jgi:hypothetical protein
MAVQNDVNIRLQSECCRAPWIAREAALAGNNGLAGDSLTSATGIGSLPASSRPALSVLTLAEKEPDVTPRITATRPFRTALSKSALVA